MKFIIIALAFIFTTNVAQANLIECGKSSWYGPGFNGNRTASGEIFNENDFTAAHKTISFGSIVLVENQGNGKMVKVKITDRGPFNSRVIDLSKAAAVAIGVKNQGIGNVCLYEYR